ncbi:hypothetical protein DV736_g2324, partial [Chaetothyriales sp. CBS 134916]
MAPTTVDDDLKLLYACVKLTGAKARMADVGKYMCLKPNATAWRFNALMKKLEKQFGSIDELDTASLQSTPPKIDKRKKVKGDGAEDKAGNVGHLSKKAKLKAEDHKVKDAPADDSVEKEALSGYVA